MKRSLQISKYNDLWTHGVANNKNLVHNYGEHVDELVGKLHYLTQHKGANIKKVKQKTNKWLNCMTFSRI